MEITPNQERFLRDFIAFANRADAIFQWVWDIKTRRPLDNINVQQLMSQAFFHEGRNMGDELQPALDSWNRLTCAEKRDIGAIWGKEVHA